ncbi:MAG: hypothetical protein WC765_07300 [Phycisphaerae bacterium]|jgi:hypothetical protein
MDKHATMSFKEKRATLLRTAKAHSSSRPVSKKVNFEGTEIPKLLRQYQTYKEESQSVTIQAS